MPATTVPYLANSMGFFGRQQEIVISTPYKRFDSNRTETYLYNDGFYQPTKSFSTHPIFELLKSEKFKRLFNWASSYFAALPDLAENQFSTVLDVFLKLINLLDEFQATNIVFERTPEDSLLLKGVIISGKDISHQLFLAIYFDDTEPAGYEAILNVFNQKKQVLAASGEVENLTKRLSSLFNTLQLPMPY